LTDTMRSSTRTQMNLSKHI